MDIEACSVMLLNMLLYFILFFTILENVIWHIANCSKLKDKNKICLLNNYPSSGKVLIAMDNSST